MLCNHIYKNVKKKFDISQLLLCLKTCAKIALTKFSIPRKLCCNRSLVEAPKRIRSCIAFLYVFKDTKQNNVQLYKV